MKSPPDTSAFSALSISDNEDEQHYSADGGSADAGAEVRCKFGVGFGVDSGQKWL